MRISKIKILILIALASFFAAFFFFDLLQYLNFEFLKSQQEYFSQIYTQYPLIVIFSFFLFYVLITGFSAPGAAILTLAAGYLFGVVIGTLVVSFASTIGATMAFLMSRFLLKDWVQKKFGNKLQAINNGLSKDGVFYLFSLRLIPAFPFFLVNLVMGLTPIKLVSYFFISQLGMFPGTLVYVNAGTELSKINSLKDILSPSLILSFIALACLPWIVKMIMKFIPLKKVIK